MLISFASSPTYSYDSFFFTRVLKIRLRSRSSAEADAWLVNVSRVVNFSGRAMVTYSVLFRLHEAEKTRTNMRISRKELRKSMFLRKILIEPGSELGNLI